MSIAVLLFCAATATADNVETTTVDSMTTVSQQTSTEDSDTTTATTVTAPQIQTGAPTPYKCAFT